MATEKVSAGEGRENGESFPGELLSMEDIYRAAGIVGPRRGYSINKVVEMLRSEHIRGLSKEMKRALVLMALDAAGVSSRRSGVRCEGAAGGNRYVPGGPEKSI